MRLAPAAMTVSASPERSAAQPWWTAVSDDEQAESMATLGPVRPRWYEMRLAVMK